MIESPPLAIHTNISNYVADLRNIVRFGIHAPRRYQTIYINPLKVEYTIADLTLYKSAGMSGRVLDGDWDQKGYATVDSWIRTIIRKRIRLNYSWKDAGGYDRMMKKIEATGRADWCRSIDDVVRRHEDLNRLIAHLKNGGRFLSRREISPGNFRERGGVVIHVARNGELLFNAKGNHRLAIAQELGLVWIPAQVGIVHLEAVKSGAFRKLTRRPAYSQHPPRCSVYSRASRRSVKPQDHLNGAPAAGLEASPDAAESARDYSPGT